MTYALGLGGFMSFYGVVGLIVWLMGDYLGWNPGSRVIVIALILLTMPFALVANYFRTRRAKKREEKESGAEPAARTDAGEQQDGKAVKPVASSEEISKVADEVITFLKESDLGATGNAVYALPWYIVAGDRGSGKSSLVLASGLNFQTLPSQRQSEMKFVKPTRQVDWRVTSDAVFVDTPGRYQAEGPDFDEWSSLLETIKKQRSNRPVDGLILTVNTEKVLKSDERDIEELAKLLRTRLDDATKRLKTRFPVYLVFTHADAIEGFRDSFSTSKKEGENLVWGATIPLEKSDNAQALFDSEFELLQDSLMQRRMIRLSAPFSSVRQLRIFNFPLHFASARRKLGTFVTTLFRPNPFSESPFLRGFYFTAAPVNREKQREAKAVPQTVGKSYFANKLFSDVILRDKDLVKTFREQRQRPPVLGWLFTIAGTFITLILLALSAYSLYINKAFLEDAVAKGQVVLRMTRTDRNIDPLTKDPAKTQTELNEINDLRAILDRMDEYEREGPPFYMRLGLYSGNRLLRDRLMYIYYVAIERRFRDPTIRRLERELAAFAAGNTAAQPAQSGETKTPQEAEEEVLERHYDLLEAYLLLTEQHKEHAMDTSAPSKLERALEKFWLEESKLPPGNEVLVREQLRFYFKQVDRESSYAGDTSGFPRVSPNPELVTNVRKRLVRYPAYKRYLNRHITEVTNEVGEISVESLLGGNSKGLIEGSVKIPGAFSVAGYRGYMKERLNSATSVLSQDDWVMGEEGKAEAIKADELSKLKSEYFNRYASAWERLIAGTRVVPYSTDDDLKNAIDTFAGSESPIKLLLRDVARNTDLTAKPESKGWLDFSWISDLWSGGGGSGEVEDSTEISKQFNQLFIFIGDPAEDKGQPINKYNQMLAEISQTLNTASEQSLREFKTQLANADEGGRSFHRTLTSVEEKVRGMTKGFETSGMREVANLLQQPLQNIRLKWGADSKTLIEKAWTDDILAKAKAIEAGYPFQSGSTPVTDLKAVSEYLNPQNGTLTTFYNNRLNNFFEGDPDTGLTLKPDSPVKFSPEFVSYLNNAFKLRKALFGGSPTPSFEYDFIIEKEGDTIIEGTIDGTRVSSRETGSFKLKFPAQSGGINGVSLNILSTTSTVTTDQGSTSSPTNLNFPGEWGLFNFLDAASSKTKTESGYNLTYSRGGQSVRIQIRPIGGDPFDRSLFTSIRAPEKILQ
ncbi:MAG TPA: type VI secretion system membrane subunit TssM [Aridibacter sp.]|nr:type VI secretion system membrane subunit TssM [Aridibacter sp.]